MKIIYHSDVMGKNFDTESECLAAEKKYNEEMAAKKKAEEEKAAAYNASKKAVDDALEVLAAAEKNYHEKLKEHTKKYGSYNGSFSTTSFLYDLLSRL